MKVKRNIAIILLGTMLSLIATAVLTVQAINVDEWSQLKETDVTGETTKYIELDVGTYGANRRIETGFVYDDASALKQYDNLCVYDKSRVIYGQKIKIKKGTTINIVAAADDTENTGGSSQLGDSQFYYSVIEFNKDGKIIYDGDWRSVTDFWTVGVTENNSKYSKDGYPVLLDDDSNKTDAKNARINNTTAYIVIFFRVATGDVTNGGGMDTVITPNNLEKTYTNFFLNIKNFNYTFKADGNTYATVNRTGLTNVSSSVPKEPTKDGYKFTGWKVTSPTNKPAGKSKQYGKVYTSSQLKTMFSDKKYWSSFFGDTVLEAQWQPLVTYDANGGYWQGNSATTWSEPLTKDEVYITEPNWYKRDGYKFVGWCTNKDKKPNDLEESDSKGYWWAHYEKDWGTDNTVTKNGINYWKGEVDVYAPKTLYAIWSKNYTVTYDANGGYDSKDSSKTSWNETANYDLPYTVVANNYSDGSQWYVRPGYTFIGWSTSKTATTGSSWGSINQSTVGSSYTTGTNEVGETIYYWKGTWTGSWAQKNKTLYAVWKPNEYTVSYNANGGADSKDSTITECTDNAIYGKDYITLSNKYSDGTDRFVREGYEFKGWNEKADGTGVDWTNYIGKSWEWNYKKNVTLYAQWELIDGIKYTVNHYQMSVDGTIYKLTDTEELSGISFSTITISDLQKNYEGFTYQGGKGTTAASATKPSSFDTTTTVLADGTRVINLYYSRNQYKVTLNKGTGISSVTGAGTYYYGASVTIDATISNGYSWSKWSGTHSTTTKKYTFTMPAHAVTDTANATVNSYTLTVNPNSGKWNNTTSNSTFTMKYKTTKTIANPTREGYTFNKWNISGTGSSLNGTTFTMGYANATLTAVWIANSDTKYVINHYQMNLDGATYTLKETEEKTGTTASTLTLNDLKKTYTGFTYQGGKGTTAASATKPLSFDTTTTILANGTRVINLYYSRNSYLLTVNGGTGISSVSATVLNSTEIENTDKKKVISVRYGSSVTINANISPGYSWSKWDGYFTQWNKSYSFYMPAKAINLTAYATANEYEVQLYANKPADTSDLVVNKLSDSEWVYDSINGCYTSTFTYDEAKNIPSPADTYSLKGYSASGWYTAATGGNNVLCGNMKWNLTTSYNGVVKLYARWTECDYKILFNYVKPDNASSEIHNNEITEKTVKYNKAVGTLPQPTLTGWKFDGWYTAVTGGTKFDSDTLYQNTKDSVLYSHWTANKYTIVFDSNKPAISTGDITGSMSNLYCTYDVLVQIPESNYSLQGWDFITWNTKADGSGTSYSVNDTVSNLSSIDGSTITLYAQWNTHIEWNATLSKVNNSSINAMELSTLDKAVNWANGIGYGIKMNNTLTYKEFGDMQGFINVNISNVSPKSIKYEFSDSRINQVILDDNVHELVNINGKSTFEYTVGSSLSTGFSQKISFTLPEYEAESDMISDKEYSAYVDISVTYKKASNIEYTEIKRVYYNVEELDLSKIRNSIRYQPGQVR